MLKKSSLSLIFIMVVTMVFAGTLNVILPSTMKLGAESLVLNGKGVRQKFKFDLFVGGLYLKEKSSNSCAIIKANEPMAIKIEVISNLITGKRLEEGMRSEFERVTDGKTKSLQPRIEALVETFKEDVKVGDVFDLAYDPADGIKIFKNNKYKCTIKGRDFKETFFTIWLGPDPVDDNLKKGMLGV